jgi:hypothetical protein
VLLAFCALISGAATGCDRYEPGWKTFSEVGGRVTDENTGAPIAGAIVFVSYGIPRAFWR